MTEAIEKANGGSAALQLAVDQKMIQTIQARVEGLLARGEINLPPDYSPGNALKSAWLLLQTTQDRNKKPVLEACSKTSVANALLDMVVQGLNPQKKQCYFIAYGQQLACQRSYFGSMAVAQRVNPEVKDFAAAVVYKGDKFAYAIHHGRRVVTQHEQSLENVDDAQIAAAYCEVLGADDAIRHTEIMTIAEIHRAWKQSRADNFAENGTLRPDSTHAKFTAEMAKKTVINRACKIIVNSSSDSELLRGAIARSDEEQAQAVIAENENTGDVIDVEAVAPAELPAAEAVPEVVEAAAAPADEPAPRGKKKAPGATAPF